MAVVGPSPLGGSGLFASAAYRPGDEVLSEPHLVRLRSGRALEASFEELKKEALELLRAHSFYRGPSDAVGEQRREAFRSWAEHTWPEESLEYREAMADAMTVVS